MIRHSVRTSLFAVLAAGALLGTLSSAASAAGQDKPANLGAFKSWTAYATGTGDSRTCYALAQPASSLPKHAKRDPIFFLVSDWPARKAKAETEVVPGYKYKDGSKVTVEVGPDKFTFFTKDDGKGGDGTAWIEDLASEGRLVDAMRRGAQMSVTGTSARGTLTRDTYSLGGISEALDAIHKACGM
ncbi:MAG: hypothetical protein KGR48_06145 [Alphaproteobacteria bacterium]|nr:hypothetical protein [Alphaproteobacteria bacterium]MDE2011558.1 hypothetical protein [Alphaproteobacteria bacterium]MDE2074487.1 hypothetical protein [Alphaproteobacteria bacterium]MDE2351272.1 hypothetical protein [Alphaproteobacteria bacterium]